MCVKYMYRLLLLLTLIGLNIPFARNLKTSKVMSESIKIEINPELGNRTLSKAEQNCETYIKYACDHPLENYSNEESSNVGIVGGKDAEIGEFPHMARIRGRTCKGGVIVKSLCGGSLISEYFVMSAAHCFPQPSEVVKELYRVVLGGWHLNYTQDTTSQEFGIAEMYLHPNGDDIALVKLNRKVEFNSYIRPICLNTILNTDFTQISLSGWGYTTNGGPVAKILQKVDLYMSSKIQSQCVAIYHNRGYIFNATNMICAGYLKGGKDACQGDSGGPLQVPSGSKCLNTYKQIGITSFGRNCGKYPGVYMKVAFYISWIENIVW